MAKCTIGKINTTAGPKFLAVTSARSKEFKTEKGAIRWAERNGLEIVKA